MYHTYCQSALHNGRTAMKRLRASAIGLFAATMVLGGSLHAREPRPETPDLTFTPHGIVPLVSYENVRDNFPFGVGAP